MTNYDRQLQQQREQYQRDVKAEARNQKIKKEAKGLNQTKRERIQESTSNYGTLTNALLNGSLTKWLFVMFMLVSTIAIFNSNSDNHWLDITYQDGQQISTFNENAYEVDYMTYSNIGEQMISNFQGITNILDNANVVFLSIATLVDGVYSFFTSETVSNTVKDFAYFIAQLRYLPFRLIELIFD
jgi:hypothetical protein